MVLTGKWLEFNILIFEGSLLRTNYADCRITAIAPNRATLLHTDFTHKFTHCETLNHVHGAMMRMYLMKIPEIVSQPDPSLRDAKAVSPTKPQNSISPPHRSKTDVSQNWGS